MKYLYHDDMKDDISAYDGWIHDGWIKQMGLPWMAQVIEALGLNAGICMNDSRHPPQNSCGTTASFFCCFFFFFLWKLTIDISRAFMSNHLDLNTMEISVRLNRHHFFQWQMDMNSQYLTVDRKLHLMGKCWTETLYEKTWMEVIV